MLWILKRTISMSTKTKVKADGKTYIILRWIFFLSRLDKKKFQHNNVNYRHDSLLREDSNPTAHLQH